jgi:hypothetical protein
MGLIVRLGCLSLGIGITPFLWLDLTVDLLNLLHLFPPFEKVVIEAWFGFLFRISLQRAVAQIRISPPAMDCFALFPVFCLLGFVLVFCALAVWVWLRKT